MKSVKKIILLSLLLVFLSFPLSAQRFKGAVIGGMNISQVDGDEVYGFKRVGGHIGLAAILPINNWDITLETVFSQKGAYEKQQYIYYLYDTTAVPLDSTLYTGEYNLRLNYVEIPLMVHYIDKERIGAGLGFSYGRLVSSSEKEHGGTIPPYSDTIPFKKNDFSVLVDLQFRIWRQLKGNVRFSYSLVPVRERTYTDVINQVKEPWTRKQYNNLFTFRLIYVFNEKYRPRVEPVE